jgi:hypothetical protein
MSLQLSAAPCPALLGGGVHVDDDRRLLVNRGVCLTTGPFIPGRSGHAAVVEYECGRSQQYAEAAEHLPYRCDQYRITIYINLMCYAEAAEHLPYRCDQSVVADRRRDETAADPATSGGAVCGGRA